MVAGLRQVPTPRCGNPRCSSFPPQSYAASRWQDWESNLSLAAGLGLCLPQALCTSNSDVRGPAWAPGPHPTSMSSSPCSHVSDASLPAPRHLRLSWLLPLLPVLALCPDLSMLSLLLFFLSSGISLPVSIPLYASPSDFLTIFPPPSLGLPSSRFLTILPA